MGEIIASLLALSKFTQSEAVNTEVDLSAIAEDLLSELPEHKPERRVVTEVEPALLARGDRHPLVVVMENLIGNAWEYTAKTIDPVIRLESDTLAGEQVFCVEDNGTG